MSLRLILLLSVLSCGLFLGQPLAAPVPRGAKAANPYFPTQVGTTWVELQDGKHEVTEIVTEVKDTTDGKQVFTLRSWDHDEGVEEYLVADTGVLWVGECGKRFETPRCLLKLPFKDGQTWESEILAGGEKQKDVHTMSRDPAVVTPAGTFQAIRVDCRAVAGSGQGWTEWFVEGRGRVKSVWGEDVSTVLMKSFTPGKAK